VPKVAELVLWREDGAIFMDSLDAKVAVITGAASGIGFGMAREFGREGMRIIVSDVSEEHLNDAVTELQSDGIECFGKVADVRSAAAVGTLAQSAIDIFDRST
jgi:NAD(P)-dependent dehydrogenase (short-subunit alcohol dehydrogenase family)